MSPKITRTPGWIGGTLLLTALLGSGGILAAWKRGERERSNAAAASVPEPSEVVTAAVATPRTHRASATAVGTVLALQSVTLKNEIAGTVREVHLTPGEIVGRGAVLVALDVSVEAASLKAEEARTSLAETTLKRYEGLLQHQAVSAEEVDRARAERDVSLAEIARIRAIIARKTIRAPFRARIGISDVHPGQYLSEGTVLTTLQGVDAAENVDFSVAQNVAAGLKVGDSIVVTVGNTLTPARIVAIDAKVDPVTRNALVRARLTGKLLPGPGASVAVKVSTGAVTQAVIVPVSALRKGPGGDHVFVLATDDKGKVRAKVRPVRAGEVLGDSVLIVEGLAAGEQVAVSGAFKLRDGVLVTQAKGGN
jgi:membrane fusion protein (multidrug efflux system)